MKKSRFWILSLLLVLVLAGCDSTTSGDKSEGGQKVSVAKSPEELGKMIGDDYWNMMDEVKALVAARPPVEEMRPKLKTLKDRYVDRFVAYGKQREALSQQQRATVSSHTAMAMSKPGADFAWMTEAVTHYRGLNNEVAEEIASMNILTQYSDFELLKKQAPREAERLGIK